MQLNTLSYTVKSIQKSSMKTEISVLHVVAGLHPNSGGPSRTVVQLTDALAQESDLAISLLTQSLAGQVTISSIETGVMRKTYETSSCLSLRLGLPLRQPLREVSQFEQPNILHSHGLWLPVNSYVAQISRKKKIPLLMHTRGMLEPWALDYHRWRKKLAMYLYQRKDLATTKLFFVTAPQEMESIRRIGLKQPVAIIANGIDLPPVSHNKRKLKYSQNTKHTAVFMSRIHPIKGILNLIESWRHVSPKHWRLLIAGNDEDGHLNKVKQRIQSLRLERSIHYIGPVEADTKKELLETADLFILPSFSENFGVVIAEALSYGIPVITTQGTPWEGLIHHGCGWWVQPTVDALTEALTEALRMDKADLQSMGEKGRKFAETFNWAHIARQTAEVYRWVLGQGEIPSCVFCD